MGIFQLNPGPDGSYHAELEAATGLDPTTPEGNIAGGCYLLGKYTAQYKDEAMAAIIDDLAQFIHRVATNEKATPAEIAALPEVAKVLCENMQLRADRL